MSAIIPNLIGCTLSAGELHLRFLEYLGAGTYGAVYFAYDVASSPDDPKCYAVKCLLKHPKGSDQHRFQEREIAYHQAASEHPNVVKLHHVIEERHYVYLVLDYCEGGDLFNSIIDRRAFVHNDARLKKVFLQLLDAVHSCHDLGIYHRDLKPENIFVSEDDEELYLGDFGLATKNKLSANFGCGTSFYMSPECVGIYSSRRPYTTSYSDIWALGVILTNMITGRSPWHSASPKNDTGFRAYMREGPSYLHRVLAVSQPASEILGRIFELDPSKRITINQLRVAIRECDTFFRDAPDAMRATLSPVTVVPEEVVQEADIADCCHEDPLFYYPLDDEPMYTQALTTPYVLATSATMCDISTVMNGPDAPSHDEANDDNTAVFEDSPPMSLASSDSDISSSGYSSSGSESDGPATPETHAQDLATVVPNLSLDLADERPTCDSSMVLGECDITAVGSKSSLSMEKNKAPRSWERLASVVQRIKILV
ncbi:hypothetical protein AcW1_005025 [Taiwanofungus camphoratus]|nr:hypothetical protein AcW2_005966 [Antrodia cinnamomea]KAI0960539.1 hypothetical protein AcW1_005025 [Antrodia cinnamomea]